MMCHCINIVKRQRAGKYSRFHEMPDSHRQWQRTVIPTNRISYQKLLKRNWKTLNMRDEWDNRAVPQHVSVITRLRLLVEQLLCLLRVS